MKIVKVYCDKCKKEITAGGMVAQNSIDLCDTCAEALKEHIREWLKAPESEKTPEVDKIPAEDKTEAKKGQIQSDKGNWVAQACENVLRQQAGEEPKSEKKKKKRIDWDKAVKMKMAGFDHAHIAEATGTTKGTIDTRIYAYLPPEYYEQKRRGRNDNIDR